MLALTSCSAGSRKQPVASERIRAAQGGVVRLGAAAIEVPAGALSADATVSIRPASASGGPVGLGAPYAFAMTPFALQPGRTVRLHLPISGPTGRSGRVAALAYQDSANRWVAAHATVAPDSAEASADVGHLSLWASFDPVAWLTDAVRHAVREHLQASSQSIDCPGPSPQVSIDGLGADAPLAVCVQPASPGHKRVTLINKRHFAVEVTPGPGLHRTNDFSLQAEGFTTVPSAGRSSFDLGSTVPSTVVAYSPDYAYTAVETLAPMLVGGAAAGSRGALAAPLLQDLYRCTRRATPAGAASNSVAAAVAALGCAAQHASGIGGMLQVGPLGMGFALLKEVLKHLPLADLVENLFVGGTSGQFTVTVAQRLPPVGANAGTGGGGATPPASRPASPAGPQPPSQQPPTSRPPQQQPRQVIVSYDVATDNSNNGKYVPAGHYWEEDFTAKSSWLTGGWVLVGANADGGDHRASIGIYTGSGHTGNLGEVIVPVSGYDGERFTFPSPIRVSVGQTLYLTVIGVGDFTVYDNRSEFMIARVEGYNS